MKEGSMKNLIKKWLGIPDFGDLLLMQDKYDEATRGMLTLREDMSQLRQDMKTLYKSMENEVSQVRGEIKRVKPVLKVEDPEAVKFIKGVLSKHDRTLNTQQEFLEERMRTLSRLQGEAQSVISKSAEAFSRLESIMNSVGLQADNDGYTQTKLAFGEFLKQKMSNKQVEKID